MSEWTPWNSECAPPKAGEPPLHVAARTGDRGAIRSLVAGGADVEQAFNVELDPGGPDRLATPLMVAAGSGDGATVDTVRALLELGADPTRVVDGHSASSFASVGMGWNYRPGGDAARLRLLLEKGAPLPANPSEANGLLCGAAALGDGERLRLLLDRGLSALGYWNADEARERSIGVLESWSARIDSMTAGLDEEQQALFAKARGDVEDSMVERSASAPASHEIPLFCAAESGDAACVGMLLESGADPEVRDCFGRTAMYHGGSVDVVSVLEEEGVLVDDADAFGMSPLASALTCGSEGGIRTVRSPVGRASEKVAILLTAGANPLAGDAEGRTPLMHAVAELCSGHASDDATCARLLDGLGSLECFEGSEPALRGDYVAAATPTVRAFVEGVAAGIPIPMGDGFAADRRRELVTCIIMLAAHEGWARGLLDLEDGAAW